MFAATRTPPKKQGDSSTSATDKQVPSGQSKVRTSIGEWETSWISHNPLKSPAKKATAAAPPSKSKAGPTQGAKTIDSRRPSSELSGSAANTAVYPNRVAEARACLNRAKLHLGNSRNTKTEIKDNVIAALDRLYQLVKEAEADGVEEGKVKKGQQRAEEIKVIDKEEDSGKEIREAISIHSKLLKESNEKMETLKRTMERYEEKLDATTTTYASVAAGHTRRQLPGQTTLHSVIVASNDDTISGSEVLEQIKEVMEAKEGGMNVDRIRKTKDRKVIVGCRTKEDRDKVKEKIKSSSKLNAEDMKNRDPLLILRDVLNINTDEDIEKGFRNQNKNLFVDLQDHDDRLEIRYRIKTRNPHACHVVLRVAPPLWNRATAAQSVYIDLQRIKVQDHSPLVQCSLCLGYGHCRRFCTEGVEKCSHCGGPHKRADCNFWKSGGEPACPNCLHAKLEETSHNAFSWDCPIRKRWDALARETIAYC